MNYQKCYHHHCTAHSLVVYRQKSTEVTSQEEGQVPLKPYSPFQVGTSNKIDWTLARTDDLVNWARKVGTFFLSFFSFLFIEFIYFMLFG